MTVFSFGFAIKVFDEMPKRILGVWNVRVSGLVTGKMSRRILRRFYQVILEKVRPDETYFVGILRAAGGKVSLDSIQKIHASAICHGFGTSPLVCNTLIDVYSEVGFVDHAKVVFSNPYMKSSVSWLAMISGLSRNGLKEEAVRLFCEMRVLNIFPTPYVFSSILSSCARRELFHVGEQLHGLVFKCGFSSQTFVCNALLTFYARWENFLHAEQIFSKMIIKDAVSYIHSSQGLLRMVTVVRLLSCLRKCSLIF